MNLLFHRQVLGLISISKARLTLLVLWSEGGKVELVSLVLPPVSDISPLVRAPVGKLHGGSDEGGRTHTPA